MTKLATHLDDYEDEYLDDYEDDVEVEYDDEGELRRAWSGRGVYAIQYGEDPFYDGEIEPVDEPRKIHADDLADLIDQHECWVGNDAMDLHVISIEKLPPDGMTPESIRQAFEEYKKASDWRHLDPEEAVLGFIVHLEKSAGGLTC